ncbi:hypothetical protein AV530_017273 [Patagioenas fasciata monilis]|uniref:Uncharacterized protein n=1 Tax=Patagioenas fasciata monilis TaxID=372326 RepID=A0A1V4JFS7_PATFA|nr:hypothetical protein AV530_017273 [Patagioenas fasciata monilis]
MYCWEHDSSGTPNTSEDTMNPSRKKLLVKGGMRLVGQNLSKTTVTCKHRCAVQPGRNGNNCPAFSGSELSYTSCEFVCVIE